MSSPKLKPGKSLADIKPEIAKEWHPTKNRNLTPNEVFPGSARKAWWKCPNDEDHEWEATLNSRTSNGNGCPFCSGRKADKQNNLAKLNPELSKEWHPSKNGSLRPENFTAKSGISVWWLCKKGHEWKTTIGNRNAGNGCPICSGRKVNKENNLAVLYPNLVEEWDQTRNGDLTPFQFRPGSNTKVFWKCSKGDDHIWKAAISERSSGSKCPYCAGRLPSKTNCLANLYPDLVKEWHPTKNEKITPKDIVAGTSKKYWWRCKHGHEWLASGDKRTQGRNCPHCRLASSLPELRIFSEIKKIFPSTQHRVTLYGHEVDIYLPELKVGIEYDGVYWHQNRIKKDSEKNLKLGTKILLIRVREKGLAKLNDTDIQLGNKELDVNIVKKIFKLILKSFPHIPNEYSFKLNEYFNNESWVASGLFNQLCVKRKHIEFEESISYLFPELVKEWHPTKNNPLLPEFYTPGSYKKVWWKCQKNADHVWEAVIYSRVSGHGCPICSGRKAIKSTSLGFFYPNLVKEWHPTKNNNLSPYDFRPGSHQKIWWICAKNKDHIWHVEIKNRTVGNGCPFCSNKKIIPSNSLAVLNPKLAAEWNHSKNENLTPYQVSVSAMKKVWWKCVHGHEWLATINNRARGRGCPKCKGNRISQSLKKHKKSPGQLDLI